MPRRKKTADKSVIAIDQAKPRVKHERFSQEQCEVAVALYRSLRSANRAKKFWAFYYNVPEEHAPAPQSILRWNKNLKYAPSVENWQHVTSWLELNNEQQIVSFNAVVLDRLLDSAENLEAHKLIYIADRATAMLKAVREAKLETEGPRQFGLVQVFQTTPVAEFITTLRELEKQGITQDQIKNIYTEASNKNLIIEAQSD